MATKQPPASVVNPGYDVPESPIDAARATLNRARPPAADGFEPRPLEPDPVAALPDADNLEAYERREMPQGEARPQAPAVQRNYAHEQLIDDMVDRGEEAIDMMSTNVDVLLAMRMNSEPETAGFRELEDKLAYERFMHEPVVIRIHATRDKNESPLVFIGINGDNRWIPRDKTIKVPRKFVERLAQAQEMLFETREARDISSDSMMDTIKKKAASYSFSVIRDNNPMGPRWLRRVTREGT